MCPGFIEVGLQRSAMRRVTFQTGEMGFFPRYMERWVGSGHQERLLLLISDAALRAARERISHTGDLDHWCKMGDVRLAALVKAVNAERIAGFPSGRLFLDSIEQAIAATLVDAFAGQSRSVRPLRGGSGALADGQRVGASANGRPLDPHRNGAGGGFEPSLFFADVSQVDRRDTTIVCITQQNRACQGDVARG